MVGTGGDSRRERKKREARARIYEAAVRLFTDRGFEATRVEDITELADVAVGTFFNHFPTKEAVLADYHRWYTERLNAYMLRVADRPVRDRFRALMEWTARTSKREQKIFRIMMRRLLLQADLLVDNFAVVMAGFEVMETWIREAQEREIDRVYDPPLIRAAITDIWNMSLLKWSGSVKAPHPRREMLQKLELLWEGVGAHHDRHPDLLSAK